MYQNISLILNKTKNDNFVKTIPDNIPPYTFLLKTNFFFNLQYKQLQQANDFNYFLQIQQK